MDDCNTLRKNGMEEEQMNLDHFLKNLYYGSIAAVFRVTRIIRTSFLATNIRHQFVKRLECINILSSAFSCC